MQALEQRPGVGDVAAHGGVAPPGVPIAVEAQVQLDEPRDVVDRLLVEAQGGEPLPRQARADHLVVMEGHPAAGLEAARRGLAHVVHDGGEA